ncbi:hypothetical protein NSQ43_10280 [Sporosarcina sp. FSL W8-0480]|uniref:hypothetical protein n=1 Tax=Sporosarcina sp. FSL W8-0480 TaxID=2954701 RepID=UPI0030DC4AAA
MEKTHLIYVGILLLLLVGCVKDALPQQSIATNENDNWKEQIFELNDKLIENDKKINELYTIIEGINSIENEAYKELNTKIHMLESLVSHIPNIEKKQGFIDEININEANITFKVNYAEMTEDNNAPNGFIIEEKKKGTISVDLGASYYILEGNQIQFKQTIEEFNEVVNDYNRFFNLYIIDGKVVMLAEQYLP